MNDVFEELSRTGFLSQMSNIYTCLPCVVVGNSNIASQMLDVQPVVNKRFKNDSVEQHPPILSVPVIFPSSSTSALTFPISIGDTVLCVFSQRGLDTFKNSSSDSRFVTPTDFRKFDKRDAIAIPGLFPFSESINNATVRSLPHSTNDLVVAHNLGGAGIEAIQVPFIGGGEGQVTEILVKAGDRIAVDQVVMKVTVDEVSTDIPSPKAGLVKTIKVQPGATVQQGDALLDMQVNATEVELRMRPDGSILIKSPSNITVECQTAVVNVSASTSINCPATEWSGNLTFNGDVTLNGALTQLGVYSLDGINMNTHVHGGVQPGASNTSVPQ